MLKDRKLEPLTAIPYYGGKSKLAYLIADLLPYDDCNSYIEGFGGSARVLLNKPRHAVEIYNELTTSVYTFFKCLADEEQAEQLISQLCETPISLEYFEECKRYRKFCDSPNDYEFLLWDINYLLNILDKEKKLSRLFRKILKNIYSERCCKLIYDGFDADDFQPEDALLKFIGKDWDNLISSINNSEDIDNANYIKRCLDDILKIATIKYTNAFDFDLNFEDYYEAVTNNNFRFVQDLYLEADYERSFPNLATI